MVMSRAVPCVNLTTGHQHDAVRASCDRDKTLQQRQYPYGHIVNAPCTQSLV